MTDYFNEPINGQAAIDVSSSGDNTIVSMFTFLTSKFPSTNIELANRRIFVTNYVINCHDCVDVQWKSNSDNLSGVMRFGVGGDFTHSSGASPSVFWTGKNQDLIINLSDAVQISGHITFYIK